MHAKSGLSKIIIIRFSLTRGKVVSALTFLLLSVVNGGNLVSETLTLTTYYPPPYAAYAKLKVSNYVDMGPTSNEIRIGDLGGGIYGIKSLSATSDLVLDAQNGNNVSILNGLSNSASKKICEWKALAVPPYSSSGQCGGTGEYTLINTAAGVPPSVLIAGQFVVVHDMADARLQLDVSMIPISAGYGLSCRFETFAPWPP